MTLVWIIAIICTAFLLIILTFFAWVAEQEKKHKDGEHHCNRCECSFVYGKKDLSRTYCPYCGHKLTKHKANPDFIETEEKYNDGKRNEENPFPDCSN